MTAGATGFSTAATPVNGVGSFSICGSKRAAYPAFHRAAGTATVLAFSPTPSAIAAYDTAHVFGGTNPAGP